MNTAVSAAIAVNDDNRHKAGLRKDQKKANPIGAIPYNDSKATHRMPFSPSSAIMPRHAREDKQDIFQKNINAVYVILPHHFHPAPILEVAAKMLRVTHTPRVRNLRDKPQPAETKLQPLPPKTRQNIDDGVNEPPIFH